MASNALALARRFLAFLGLEFVLGAVVFSPLWFPRLGAAGPPTPLEWTTIVVFLGAFILFLYTWILAPRREQ